MNSNNWGGGVTPSGVKTSHLPSGAMTVSVSSSAFTRTLSVFVVDAMRAAMEKADALDESCGFGGEVGRLATRTSSMATAPGDVVADRRGPTSDGGGMAYPSVRSVNHRRCAASRSGSGLRPVILRPPVSEIVVYGRRANWRRQLQCTSGERTGNLVNVEPGK